MLAYEYDVEGEGDFEAPLLHQLASPVLDIQNLKRLRYDAININYIDRHNHTHGQSKHLDIRCLELRDAVDDYHRGEWSTAYTLLDLCKDLEEFHLEIRNTDV